MHGEAGTERPSIGQRVLDSTKKLNDSGVRLIACIILPSFLVLPSISSSLLISLFLLSILFPCLPFPSCHADIRHFSLLFFLQHECTPLHSPFSHHSLTFFFFFPSFAWMCYLFSIHADMTCPFFPFQRSHSLVVERFTSLFRHESSRQHPSMTHPRSHIRTVGLPSLLPFLLFITIILSLSSPLTPIRHFALHHL